jgi:hypothetical protein
MNDTGARFQTTIALLLSAVAVASAAGVDLVARDPRLAAWIDGRDRARFERGEELYVNRGNFLEFEDRLLLDEIPGTDYGRGGVYFFGSSNLKWALKTWELPPEERSLIGNYGIGAVSHALEAQFIRFLVEKRGLGRAADGHTAIVLGSFWSNGLNWPPETYFGPLWRRHGLYTYDERSGIDVARLDPLTRRWRLEKARCSGFLGGNANRLARAVALALGQPLDATEKMTDPAQMRAWVHSSYGSIDWRGPLTDQMRALGELIDYLKERRIEARIVLLPRRAAFDDVPIDRAYRDEVTALARDKEVPLADLSHLLAEDEFWDGNHYNAQGLAKTHEALMRIAREHLRAVGLIGP